MDLRTILENAKEEYAQLPSEEVNSRDYEGALGALEEELIARFDYLREHRAFKGLTMSLKGRRGIGTGFSLEFSREPPEEFPGILDDVLDRGLNLQGSVFMYLNVSQERLTREESLPEELERLRSIGEVEFEFYHPQNGERGMLVYGIPLEILPTIDREFINMINFYGPEVNYNHSENEISFGRRYKRGGVANLMTNIKLDLDVLDDQWLALAEVAIRKSGVTLI